MPRHNPHVCDPPPCYSRSVSPPRAALSHTPTIVCTLTCSLWLCHFHNFNQFLNPFNAYRALCFYPSYRVGPSSVRTMTYCRRY